MPSGPSPSVQFSQFVAVATTYFVDRVSEQERLPEAWQVYLDWAKCLTEHDFICTFNYDRVVEHLLERTGKQIGGLYKLHGSVPKAKEICDSIHAGRAITTLYTPGPHKIRGMEEDLLDVWNKAANEIAGAWRLVVIGYSFPATDANARSFVLRHSKVVPNVDVVLGPGGGDAIQMFSRFRPSGQKPNNRGLLAQQFLADGTVFPAEGGRFRF